MVDGIASRVNWDVRLVRSFKMRVVWPCSIKHLLLAWRIHITGIGQLRGILLVLILQLARGGQLVVTRVLHRRIKLRRRVDKHHVLFVARPTALSN